MYTRVDVGQCFRIQGVYTAFDEWIRSDYFFVGERHNFWELVLVLSGRVGVTAGEDAREMEAGQGILHSPMEFHRVWYAGVPARILIFTFSGEGLPADAGGRFRIHDPERPEQLLAKTRENFTMRGIFVEGLREHSLDAQLVIKEWEIFLLEQLRHRLPVQRIPRTVPAKNYAAIVRVLEENVSRNLSIEAIAQLCSMSPVSVKQTFSRYAGMGVINYFNRLKIQAAIVLLREGSTVQEAAEALGFSSQNYFSTVFKRIHGLSPTAYKAQLSETEKTT